MGFTEVWIVGGDGTLNYFINKYPDCLIPLFIFKGGTGNDFAWKLYGNKKLDNCLQTALNASAKAIDAGICNEKFFLNGVGIGFDCEIVRSIHQEKFFLKGHLAYYAAVLRKIFFFREKELEIITKDISWKEHCFMLTIANGSRYGGGFLVAPEAIVDDGMLDIVLIRSINLFQRLLLLPGASKGKHLRIAKCTKSDAVVVRCNKKISAHIDGEAIETDHFDIKIVAQKFLFRF